MDYTLIGFLLYLAFILVIGFITYRNTKSHKDYFLAGRKLNPWVVAFSERASGESAWLLLGLPGLAYGVGLIGFWDAIGCVSGIIFYWFVIAQRLREQTELFNSITLPNFFAQNFDERHRNIIRMVALLIIVFFFTFYLASQFNAAGKVLKSTFGIEHFYGVVLGTVVIIFYTMMGGFFAVAWTDMIQGIIMVGALVILPVAGWLELQANDVSFNESLANAPQANTWFGGKTGWAAIALAVSGLSWGFGYMGQPHLLTRFMSIKDPKKIRVSRKIAIWWALLAFGGAMFVGLVSIAHFGPEAFGDREMVMPELTNDILPAWLAGIFISGAIAAMMSTADSQLLIITSSVIEDFYHKTLKRDVSQKRLLYLSRGVTIVVGLMGFILAIESKELVFRLVSYAWGGLGSAFGPALLLILWWPRITAHGVIAGMITGAMVTIIWTRLEFLDAFLSARFVSFTVALLMIVVTSLFTQKAKRKLDVGKS